MRQQVLETLAHVEAFIDFPDEDIDPDTDAALRARMDAALAETAALLATAGRGKVLREGVRTVIFGEPNVGKSSLLNLLLGYERAIVSTRPGTTRDMLEETVALAGIPLRLADTAGVRATDDELEQAGIERTHRALEGADLVLRVVDASAAMRAGWDTLPAGGNARRIVVLNKCDLGEHPSWAGVGGVRLSCITAAGMDALTGAISEAVLGGAARADWSAAINARHAGCLESAAGFLRAGLLAMDEGLSPEFIAEELRAAMSAIGDIVGRADSDEVLGVIFSSFCIGK